MIYTLAHGVQPTLRDRLLTTVKYGAAGVTSVLAVLLIGNLLYAHYYVPAPATGAHGGGVIQAQPVAISMASGPTTMTGSVDTAMMQASNNIASTRYTPPASSNTWATSSPTTVTRVSSSGGTDAGSTGASSSAPSGDSGSGQTGTSGGTGDTGTTTTPTDPGDTTGTGSGDGGSSTGTTGGSGAGSDPGTGDGTGGSGDDGDNGGISVTLPPVTISTDTPVVTVSTPTVSTSL